MARDSRNNSPRRDWVSLAIELASAATMITIGTITTLSQSASVNPPLALLAAGTILTTIGSILLSWTLSKLVAVRTATNEMRDRLKPINLNVGQHLGSILNIIKMSWGESEISAIKRQLREAAENVRLQVGHVQSLIGQAYDTSETDQTFVRLDEQQERLDAAVRGGNRKEIEEANRELAKSVGDLRRTFGARSIVTVNCPVCGTANQGQISDAPNTSAHIRCGTCSTQYPIHRNAQLIVFAGKAVRHDSTSSGEATATNEPNTVTRRDPPGVNCPTCGQLVPIKGPFPEEGAAGRVAVCMSCRTGLMAWAGGRAEAGAKFTSIEIQSPTRVDKRLFGECPTCGESYPLQFRREHNRIGFCMDDRQILVASEEQLGETV